MKVLKSIDGNKWNRVDITGTQFKHIIRYNYLVNRGFNLLMKGYKKEDPKIIRISKLVEDEKSILMFKYKFNKNDLKSRWKLV